VILLKQNAPPQAGRFCLIGHYYNDMVAKNTKLEDAQIDAITQGYIAEVKDSPQWMHPYTQMLLVRRPSGFILQVAAYDPNEDKLKVMS
jgi:hypothetical protein